MRLLRPNHTPCGNSSLAPRATDFAVANSSTPRRIFSNDTFASSLAFASLLALFTLACGPGAFAQADQASAQAQANAGTHVQLQGELEVLNKDFKDHAEVSYSLKLANGQHLPMHFTTEPPTHLLTGDHVQAEGNLSNSGLLLYSGSNLKSGGNKGNSPTTAPAAPTGIPVANTFGTQSTLVMLVNFQDDAVQPYTMSEVQTMFSGTVNNFFVENSYGQTSIAPTVVGWYTIPDSVTACNTAQIATDANNAATAAGVNLSSFNRYVYFYPYSTACAFSGASNVGGKPSQSWINGTLDPHVLDHEMGHAFGLWHSHSLDCGTSATICSNGNQIEYGDLMDTMGVPQTASADYNAFQKERLGWLNYGASPSIQTVTASGTYTINAYEQGGLAGPSALKILKSTDPTTGAKTWYYLEARKPLGVDAFLTSSIYYTQNETNGVLFHTGTDGNGNASNLLDMTPSTPTATGWWDMSLAVGQTFTDSTAKVTVTVTSVSSAGATVQVTL